MNNYTDQDYLVHHGVPGQKWGVRNGPPYPIDHKVMVKGTQLNSVSSFLNSDSYATIHKTMYTFNPNDPWDSAVYKGAFSYFLATGRGAMFIAEHQYETTKDLKMPTRKERVDEFIDLYKNNTKMVAKDLDQVRDLMKKYQVADESGVYNLNLKDLKTQQDFDAAYEVFNHAMEHYNHYKSTKKYMDVMQTKYDAMVDDNNQGIYNNVHDPVIIFRANEVLKAIGPARMLQASEILSNMDTVRDELKKEGKNLKI